MNDQPFYQPIKMLKRLHGKYWYEYDCYLPTLEEHNEEKVEDPTIDQARRSYSATALKELKRMDYLLREHLKTHNLAKKKYGKKPLKGGIEL